MPEAPLNRPIPKSQALKSWIACLTAGPLWNQSDREPKVPVHDGQKERMPGQRHDLNKCTLQALGTNMVVDPHPRRRPGRRREWHRPATSSATRWASPFWAASAPCLPRPDRRLDPRRCPCCCGGRRARHARWCDGSGSISTRSPGCTAVDGTSGRLHRWPALRCCRRGRPDGGCCCSHPGDAPPPALSARPRPTSPRLYPAGARIRRISAASYRLYPPNHS